MEMKVLWAGALFLGGWLWFFLFVRQFLFNFTVAFPLIKGMNRTENGLMHKAATRYTVISAIICALFIGIVLFVIIRFCAVYLMISFFVGGAVGFVLYINKFTPKNRQMFDAFCNTYYQFVPDDELRTAMYNKKTSQMKLRLHTMGLSTDFIPDFKDSKK